MLKRSWRAGADAMHQIHALLLLTGSKSLMLINFKDIARSIPQVTSGKYYNLCFTFYIV